MLVTRLPAQTRLTFMLALFAALAVLKMQPAECKLKHPNTNTNEREQILLAERQLAIGGALKLLPHELDMEKFLQNLKQKEYRDFDEEKFLPAHDFLTVKENITQSSLFPVLKTMPKGSSLHTHILAAVDVNFIVKNLSYIDHLYMYQWNDKLKLKFMNESEAQECQELNGRCENVAEQRAKRKDFDQWLTAQLTITVAEKTKNARWTKLSAVFTCLYDMLTYRPAFEKYLWQAMQELQDDRVLYAEFRGTFMEFYELDGRKYDVMESLKIMVDVIDKFTVNNTEFIGAKYIYAPYRKMEPVQLHESMKLLREAHRKYPRFIVGLDFVGCEDAGGYLKDYLEELQRVHKDIKFYFHAGETNWQGTATDLNVLDAILLGATRIGHALSLWKHPELLRLVKERKIAIEIAPVSNQVLRYVDDLRNHPAVLYAAYGIPLIISNDDPTAFGNTGLTYDFYLAFMAMTGEESCLGFLKTTALNSIGYSSLNPDERKRAFQLFDDQWQQFTSVLTALKTILFKFMLRNN